MNGEIFKTGYPISKTDANLFDLYTHILVSNWKHPAHVAALTDKQLVVTVKSKTFTFI